MCKFKRKKQFHYNGEIPFTDWEAGKTWETKIDIPKEVINTFNESIPEIKESNKYISVADVENPSFLDRIFNDLKTKKLPIPSQTITFKNKKIKVYNNGDNEKVY